MRILFALLFSLTVACGTAPATCSTMNCVGCCDSTTSKCLAGTEATACGTKGNLCIACPAQQTCSAGTCMAPAQATGCAPNNCGGCCENGKCLPGIFNGACGNGGVACTTCGLSKTCQVDPATGGSCR